MSRLKIVALQQDIVQGNKEENLITTAHNLNRLDRDTDVVVIPELFSTGFIEDPELASRIAEGDDGHTMDAVARWAEYFNFAICGSHLATDGRTFYNRAFFIEPSGDRTFYDKRHLFSLSGESRLYKAGDSESKVVRFRGWNFKVFVCYDLRFPVWCRKHENEYDVLLFPSNWAHSRIYQYKQLLIARAIENNAIVVGCNRIGQDAYGDYPPGDSAIYDLRGHEAGTTDAHGNLVATFDYDEFSQRRARFATWRDADDFRILMR